MNKKLDLADIEERKAALEAELRGIEMIQENADILGDVEKLHDLACSANHDGEFGDEPECDWEAEGDRPASWMMEAHQDWIDRTKRLASKIEDNPIYDLRSLFATIDELSD